MADPADDDLKPTRRISAAELIAEIERGPVIEAPAGMTPNDVKRVLVELAVKQIIERRKKH